MNKDLAEHLVNDKDNKFHATSVAQRLRDFPDMTLGLYLEVQLVWEGLQRERAFHGVTKVRYRDLCGELKALLEENT